MTLIQRYKRFSPFFFLISINGSVVKDRFRGYYPTDGEHPSRQVTDLCESWNYKSVPVRSRPSLYKRETNKETETHNACPAGGGNAHALPLSTPTCPLAKPNIVETHLAFNHQDLLRICITITLCLTLSRLWRTESSIFAQYIKYHEIEITSAISPRHGCSYSLFSLRTTDIIAWVTVKAYSSNVIDAVVLLPFIASAAIPKEM